MRPTVAIALFCDSVRQEKSGSESIIGVMSDNVNIAKVPSLIPRVSLYVRLQIDRDVDPNPIKILLSTPDGREEPIMDVDPTTVDKSRESARERDKPFGGVVCRVEMAPFHVPTYGRLGVIVQTKTERIIAGTLAFLKPEEEATSNEPELPS